jgi:hypothetical protein
MMSFTYLQMLGWIALVGIAVFTFYWKGFQAGKREGYIRGRSLTRVVSRNDC